MANKRKKKKAQRRVVNRGKSFASAVELVRFRQNVARANKRIVRLEKEGLEPPILSFVKGALGDRIHIPRNLSEIEYNKIKNITERFLATKTSRLPSAREYKQKRREGFHKKVLSAFREAISESAENYLFYAMGDIDVKTLTESFVYEEILIAVDQLANVNIRPTTDLVRDVLENNLYFVIENELQRRGVETESALRDYVQLAIEQGIEAAERQYYQDMENE